MSVITSTVKFLRDTPEKVWGVVSSYFSKPVEPKEVDFVTLCIQGDLKGVQSENMVLIPEVEKSEGFLRAVWENQSSIVRHLLQYNVRPETVNIGFQKAVEMGDMNLIELILIEGKVTDQKTLNTALKTACENGNLYLSEYLVKKGANVVSGLRVAKSTNIIKMLYRYENKDRGGNENVI